MLKNKQKVELNITECTYMVINGAKKRRALALSAIKALNGSTNIQPNISVVK